MSLSVHTNYASLSTQNQLGKTNSMLSTAMQRLGTGLRINSAADDAAGLQIATRLQTQSNGQKVGMSNAQDAISMMQTAEGALSEVTSIGQRMKDIATQASNGSNGKAEYKALNDEYSELGKELSNILSNTQYGEGKQLFGTAKTDGVVEVVGQDKVDAVTAVTAVTQVLETDGTVKTAGVVGVDAVAAVTAVAHVAGVEGKAKVDGTFDKAVTFQIGSSKEEVMNLDISAQLSAVTDAQAKLGDVFSQDMGKAALESTNTLLEAVGALRGKLGSSINRLDHTINNLGNMNQNTELSKGRIMDADFASESASMTKNQLLMQSGMSVLGKSNQVGGMVMGLLR